MNISHTNGETVSNQVNRALALNEEFHRLVFEGRWQEACEIERERRRVLQHLFESPLDPSAHDLVLSALRRIRQSDQVLLKELEVARELCLREMSKLHQGHLASSTYLMMGTGTLQ